MSPCTRFEEEALELWQRGEPLDLHFDTCADCLDARDTYERLGQMIGESGADLRADSQWQAKVWARIAREQESKGGASAQGRRWFGGWWRFAAPLGIAVMTLMAVWLPTRGPQIPSLEMSLEEGAGSPRRGLLGKEARVGDDLTLEARTAGHGFAEIRLYRNDSQLIFQCSEEPPCRREGGRLIATVSLSATGRYQSLLFLSDTSLPPSVGSFDADAAAALESGIQLIRGTEIEVR